MKPASNLLMSKVSAEPTTMSFRVFVRSFAGNRNRNGNKFLWKKISKCANKCKWQQQAERKVMYGMTEVGYPCRYLWYIKEFNYKAKFILKFK